VIDLTQAIGGRWARCRVYGVAGPSSAARLARSSRRTSAKEAEHGVRDGNVIVRSAFIRNIVIPDTFLPRNAPVALRWRRR